MSRLEVSFEKKDAHYNAGERIRGLLILNIDKQLKLSKIGVKLIGTEYPRIFTGRNNVHQEHIFLEKTIDLRKGGVVNSGSYKSHFEFDLPQDLLPTYKGVKTDIKYAIVGFCDLEALFDKIEEVSKEILIVRGHSVVPKEGNNPKNFQSEVRKNKPHFSVSLKESNFRRGEHLEGTISVFNPNNSNMKGVKLTLFAIESLVEYAQANVVYKSEYKISASKLFSGTPNTFSILIPTTEPWTYKSTYSKVDWKLEADIVMPWWGHVKAESTIQVF